MRETITMNTGEQRRAWVLTKVLVGELTISEAQRLGLLERSVWRLKARFTEQPTEPPSAMVSRSRARRTESRC
jgi:hypothetical protein